MLVLCTLSTETTVASALPPASPKPLLQVSRFLSVTVDGKVEKERQSSNDNSSTQPFNKMLYTCHAGAHRAFLSRFYAPKI